MWAAAPRACRRRTFVPSDDGLSRFATDPVRGYEGLPFAKATSRPFVFPTHHVWLLGCDAVPRITFTSSLQRHVSCPPESVGGATVREALEQYFTLHPPTRGYVLDEQGALRQHVVIFVSGSQLRDRASQQDPISEGVEIYVMQALSGG